MLCKVKERENFIKHLEERKLKGSGTGMGNQDEATKAREAQMTNVIAQYSQLEAKNIDGLSDSEGKNKRGRKPSIDRCNSCEGCLQKEPCGSCGSCTGSASRGQCSKMVCKMRQKKYIENMKMKKTSESPKQDTLPKIEYQMSIAEKLKLKQLSSLTPKTQTKISSAQSTPGSSQPGSPKPPGKIAMVPRCGVCAGCVRTEKCDECCSCINKTGQCIRKRCVEKTKASNLRNKEKKKSLMAMGDVKVSDSSDVESLSAIDSPISQSPINNGPCNECEGCTRTEDCGTCFKCTAGKKGCYRRQCFVRKREAEKRSYLNKKMVKPPQMKACGDCVGCKSSNCNECENCIQILAGNISMVCMKKQCVFLPVKQTGSTPKPSNKKCGSCEGCLADFCRECNYCLTGNEKIMVLCMKRRCKNNKVSTKRRVRCHECEGCKRENCGECAICVKKAKGELTNSFCSKRKCINFNEPVPSKKAKRTRCGECTGCNSSACGECVTCQKGYPQLCRAKHCTNPIISENSFSPKKPKMKRIRCGECTGCMSDPCGLCSICQKAPQLCKTRWCTNATMREVVKREKIPRTPKTPKTKGVYQKGSNPRRFKRCGTCKGCNMPDCGACASCKMNEQFGDEMELGKAACLEIVCEDPIDLYMTRLDGGEEGKAGHYEQQCLCEGCTKEECGECENCKGDPKFGGTDNPVKICVHKECQKRTRKKTQKFKKGANTSMLKLMAEQEDGTCPTKVINGILYDFRCYFCKKLPRVGSANRSELYRHYAVYHYAAEIKAEFGYLTKCPHCSADLKGSYVSHMGQKHNEVDKYLPEAARIPISIQGKGGGGMRHRRGAVIVRKRQLDWIWPEIPDGHDPNGEERFVTIEENENDEDKAGLVIDGFEIENNYDVDEEPLLVSRDDPVNIPDNSGKGALCTVCKSTFAEIVLAVLHIHDVHNIKGGSSHILLDTDRLMKSGYIKLTDGVTETKITDAGKKSINPVPQLAEQGDTQKKPTARKSTTTSPRDKPPPSLTQQTNIIGEVDIKAKEALIPDGISMTRVPAKPAAVPQILSAADESALRKSKIMEAIRINKMGLNMSTNGDQEIKEVARIDIA
eukprot:GFUD01015946.1.p1 GENE.GFUD01015946.1~~GFUD01015946.1.p1  ORF type:complete len:1168 (+),score=214.68 GFUD01015946.1:221-3505(+)